MNQVFCESCGSVIDSESRGCENPRCEKVDAIALSLVEHLIREEIEGQKRWLKTDDVFARAIRRGAIHGLELALELVKGRVRKNRLVEEVKVALGSR